MTGADASGRVQLRNGMRLLVMAPHPDDESLGTAGLVQQALRSDVQVRIWQWTDGDDNPWPQRWLERRLWIGADDRRRWGERRCGEVRRALACLGLPADAWSRLGWPDMGVTTRLRRHGAALIEELAERLCDWAPDAVALPALRDRHPDHGSCHVLTRLALARAGLRPQGLAYMVHGRAESAPTLCVDLDPGMLEAKRCAVMAHHTQVALARRRLLGRVRDTEWFAAVDMSAGSVAGPLRLPWRPPPGLRRHALLTLASADGVRSWSWHRAPLRETPIGAELDLEPGAPAFVRLELPWSTPWIFDRWGWADLTAAPAMDEAAG